MVKKVFSSDSTDATIKLGEQLGRNLKGGETIEFLSDLGGGKTTFITGLNKGFGSEDPVASPSFTISYTYSRQNKKQLHHFDFYRLEDAGIVGSELAEFLQDPESVIVIEWGDIVHNVLPAERVKVSIQANSETGRTITIEAPERFDYLLKGVHV